MKVDVIIAGAQKCGTTALHSFLSDHPKIVGSSPKEVDFFSYKNNFAKGIDRYHSKYFDKPFLFNLRGIKFMEASPSYIADGDIESTANRIYDYNPNVKIISLVRNPIERAYSAWYMYKKRFEKGKIDWWQKWMENNGIYYHKFNHRQPIEYESFIHFVKREIECELLNQKIECPVLSIGKYYKGISIFQQKFKENFMVIKNEDLNERTSEELEKIAQFLNLSTFDWSQFDKVKVFKGNYKLEIDDEAQSLLNEYYRKSNEKLNKLTGISY